MTSDLALASASELFRLMEARQVTSRELPEVQLKRIDRFNPDVNAVAFIDADRAREQIGPMRRERPERSGASFMASP